MRACWLLTIVLLIGTLSLQADTQRLPPETLLLAQVAGRKVVPHQVLRITGAETSRAAEVAVAIDPENPERVIASAHGFFSAGGKRGGNAAYFSADGGRTWKVHIAPNTDQRIQGDDVVFFGVGGVACHAYIAFRDIRTDQPTRAVNGIFVRRTTDGVTWSDPVPVIDHINSVEPFEDKPWFVADHGKDSKYRGHIYCAWTRFDVYGSKKPEHKSHIYVARSIDRGKNFLAAVRISDRPGNAVDDSDTLEGAVPAVGTKGEVYVAWAGPEGILFDKSIDGGVTFGKDRQITDNPGGWDFPAAGLQRHNGMPVTGVDHSNGPHRGSIYVAWIDKRNTDPDVFVAHSRDGGQTWSPPVRVNDDPLKNGKEQLFTWMAVDPADGSINLVFLDRRSLKGNYTDVTVARSIDGGKTFVNYFVAQPAFAISPGVFYGDYNGIAACQGRVIAVYPHFLERGRLAVSAAVFRFKPGTQEVVKEAPTETSTIAK